MSKSGSRPGSRATQRKPRARARGEKPPLPGKRRRTPADGAALSAAAAETRGRLLDAAEADFGTFGFEGSRLDRIAQALGVKTPLIHHYFDGKDALYQAVVTRALDALTTELGELLVSIDALPGSSEPASERGLARLAEALVRRTQQLSLRHQPLFAILRQDARSGRGATRAILVARMRPALDALAEALASLQRRGALSPDLDPRHLLLSIVAMAAFATIEPVLCEALWPASPSTESFLAERAREVTALALDGARAR